MSTTRTNTEISGRPANNWYYRLYGLELGPISFEELLELASSEQLTASDQVKLGGHGKWRLAGSIGRLMAALPYSPVTRVVETSPRTATPAPPLVPSPALLPQETPPIASRSTQRFAAPPGPRSATQSISTRSPLISTQSPGATSSGYSSPLAPSQVVPVDTKENGGGKTIPSAASLPRRVASAVSPSVSSPSVVAATLEVDSRRTPPSALAGSASASSNGTAAWSSRANRSPVIKDANLFGRVWETLSEGVFVRGVGAAAVMGLLGYGIWSFAGGPVRPVSVHPVKGRVIIDGQPVANASVVLHRIGESKVPANLHPRARANESGIFELETFDPADGAPNGEFIATVLLNQVTEVNGERQAGPNILPAVYSRPDTSPLKLTITASTSELQPLELTRK